MMKLSTYIAHYWYIFLFLIVLLGGFLRFYHLTQSPPSLNWDEVAFGYNAYSILHTGKDEYGHTLPMYLRSLDDYKRPVYAYATVASVAVFGLNDFAVRFPSAFFGTLTIILVYFLTLLLWNKKNTALLAALFLSILPWHIQFSHAGFEAVIGFFLTTLGVLCSVYGVKKHPWFLVPAAFAFGLSLYSYLGQRIAVPICMLTLAVLYYREILAYLRSQKKNVRLAVIVSAVVMALFVGSVVYDSSKPEGNIRFKATSVFSNSSEYDIAFARMQSDAKQKINLTRRVFHDNRLFTSVQLVMRGYLVHFSPEFFFFDFGQHHAAPGVGNLYLWMLPFLVFGIYALCKKGPVQVKYLLLLWILGPPLAGAVTYQVPHSLRVGDMMIPIVIVIALGAEAFFHWIRTKKKHLEIPIGVGFVLVGLFYLIYFFHQYFVHFPLERSREWVYGRQEAVRYAEQHKGSYDRVIVSNNLEFPYIFFLYYSQYDPQKYLSEGGTKSGGFAEEGNAFDRYAFHHFTYADEVKKGNILFIGKPEDFPANAPVLKKIYYLNGQEAIYIVGKKV